MSNIDAKILSRTDKKQLSKNQVKNNNKKKKRKRKKKKQKNKTKNIYFFDHKY